MLLGSVGSLDGGGDNEAGHADAFNAALSSAKSDVGKSDAPKSDAPKPDSGRPAAVNGQGKAGGGAPAQQTGGAKGVDYGDIPQAERWRYDRYLAKPATTPKLAPAAWYQAALRVRANNRAGNGFEQQARKAMLAPLGKGSKPVQITGSDGKTYVPDLPVGDEYGVTDVKNGKHLSNDPQLKAFGEYAKANKLPFNLVISPKTESMSEPLLANVRESGGTVTQFDPATKAFSEVPIGETGYWQRSAAPPEAPAADHGPAGGPAEVPETAAGRAAVPGEVRPPATVPERAGPSLVPEPGGMAGGAAMGLVTGVGVAAVQFAATGKVDPQTLEQAAKSVGESTVLGAVASKGEQLIAPTVERAVGAVAPRLAAAAGTGGGDAAATLTGTLAARAAGGTIVGAVISAGVSAWENRAGLVHGDSKAIGNVVADTVVGAGSVAGAMLIGAAAGSAVPVAGTLVGAGVGLLVGLGITYGAQLSGLRNVMAEGAADAVNGIKDAGKAVGSAVSHGAKSVASGVSHAAGSVAHFFGL